MRQIEVGLADADMESDVSPYSLTNEMIRLVAR